MLFIEPYSARKTVLGMLHFNGVLCDSTVSEVGCNLKSLLFKMGQITVCGISHRQVLSVIMFTMLVLGSIYAPPADRSGL